VKENSKIMGHVSKTSAGNFRANWRNLAGRQESKTFATEREANAYLAEMEVAKTRGTYVSPRAGKTKLIEYARRWLAGRNDEKTTAARDRSIIRTHILPTWGNVPLGKIDHSSVQQWVTKLGQDLSPATVRECGRLLTGILALATRDRVIALNPAEGIRLPKRRQTDAHDQTITRVELTNSLLPEIPARYRALVALAAGCGLRWGECIGLSWNAIDLDNATVNIGRVAVEVAGNVTIKAYPKSKAGRRSVPAPPFVIELLKQHRELVGPRPDGSIFANEAGGPMRRTTFRASIWRPALTRAGLLGKVVQLDKRLWAGNLAYRGRQRSQPALPQPSSGPRGSHEERPWWAEVSRPASPTPHGWYPMACRSTTSRGSWDMSTSRPRWTDTRMRARTATTGYAGPSSTFS